MYMRAEQAVEQRFLEAYDAHADAVFRHCSFRVFNRERAKEIAQEAFCRTWEALAEGQDIQNIRAFAYRVANNLIIDESRKKKESSLEALAEAGFDPGSAPKAVDVVEAERAQACLQNMDAAYRDAVVMRYVDDLTPKEIADITGESQNVISVRIHRGLKLLRARFVRL
jgi:RNA polymerase sigma-70 factor (ECF subfamily)